MTTITIISILSGLAILFSLCTVGFSIMALIKVIAMEKSTHQIQYMPVAEYGSFQEAIEKNEDLIKDEADMPITDPEQKEKVRERRLMEQFEGMYDDGTDF